MRRRYQSKGQEMTKTQVLTAAWQSKLLSYYKGSEWAAPLPDTDYPERLKHFAALVIAQQQKRADALAETIVALRCVVTNDTETKSDFITRVKAILSACPDTRVLQAVLAEREACAELCEAERERLFEWGYGFQVITADKLANAIRARGEK